MARIERPKKTIQKADRIQSSAYLEKISTEIQSNQSRLSMVLGALILLVIGTLVFNYFNRTKPSLGPAQQTQQEDVSSTQLPGKYTVKEGDTLFTIADKYYQDGDKFTEIAKANNLNDVNSIETEQVLEIPKLEEATPAATTTPEPTTAPDVTTWGAKINSSSYTVQEGDWLSTIAARAYGDMFAYKKLAEANKITNPDYIVPGMVLTIPR